MPPQQRFRRQKALVAWLLAADVGCCLGDHAEPDGRGQGAQRLLWQGQGTPFPLHEGRVGAFRHILEVVRVKLQDRGCPGQGFGDAGAQFLLKVREHLHPGPRPGKGWV